MSKLFSAAGIAEQALRKIGAMSPYDTTADAVEQAIALDALDLIVAELTGTMRMPWLVPVTASIPLTIGTASYNLTALLQIPLQFITAAYVVEDGEDREVDLIRRTAYEAIEDKAESGQVEAAYIDRSANPSAFLHRVPAVAGLKLRVLGQGYAPDLTASKGNVAHGFFAPWQRYLVHRLACDIGSGSVRTIPAGQWDRFKGEAAEAERDLKSYTNREQISRPRFTRPWGL